MSEWPQPHQSTPHTPWPAQGPYQVLEGGPPPGRRGRWGWLVAVLAVVVVAAGAAGVILKVVHRVPGHAPSAPSTSAVDGRAQASAIDALLNASSASRNQLAPALNQIETCGDWDYADKTLQQIVAQRTDQVRQGQALAVDGLTNGAQLKSALVQALNYSLQADQSFAAWLATVRTTPCNGHAAHEANYNAAQSASSSATTSKQTFVALWNPVAAQYGLPSRTDTGF
jgi:hypothetical protein